MRNNFTYRRDSHTSNNSRRSRNKHFSTVLSLAAIAVIIGALVVWNRATIEPQPQPQEQPLVYSTSEAPEESSTAAEPPATNNTQTNQSSTTKNTAVNEASPKVPTNTATTEQETLATATAATVTEWVSPGHGQWTSTYGYRLDPTLADYRFHHGADMELAQGAVVFTVADGVISKIYNDPQWGDSIEVSHAGGFTSIYHGVKASQIAVGDKVDAGETIGVVTASPPAESQQKPHLHLEITLDGTTVDPQQYLK